jgi:hypothetical protein
VKSEYPPKKKKGEFRSAETSLASSFRPQDWNSKTLQKTADSSPNVWKGTLPPAAM